MTTTDESTLPDLPRIRLSLDDPQELLGLVPYLIGFQPQESLVLVLCSGRRFILAARVNLPPVAGAASLARYGRALAEAHQAAEAVVVVFSDQVDRATRFLDRYRSSWMRAAHSDQRAGRAPRPLVEALLADGQHWWCRMGPVGRRPGPGTPYDPLASAAAATAVLAGLPTMPTRDELARTVAGPPGSERATLAAGVGRAARDLDPLDRSARMGLLRDVLVRWLDSPATITDSACATLAALVCDIEVRDLAWSMITPGNAGQHVDLWSAVTRRVVDDHASAPLCLAAVAAWIGGQGALMNCCVERALDVDPDYSMAALLNELSLRAVPPSAWHEFGAELTEEIAAD